MPTELWLLGGIIAAFLIIVFLRKHKKAKAIKPMAPVVSPRSPVRNAPPPPLPAQRTPSLPHCLPVVHIWDYPKCPIDRSRNEPGKPQAIFRDVGNRCYFCRHGHRFTGRE